MFSLKSTPNGVTHSKPKQSDTFSHVLLKNSHIYFYIFFSNNGSTYHPWNLPFLCMRGITFFCLFLYHWEKRFMRKIYEEASGQQLNRAKTSIQIELLRRRLRQDLVHRLLLNSMKNILVVFAGHNLVHFSCTSLKLFHEYDFVIIFESVP